MKPLEPHRHIVICGIESHCSYTIAASWRWVTESYTNDAKLYVCPALKGQRQMIMPPLQELSPSNFPAVKPVCSAPLTAGKPRLVIAVSFLLSLRQTASETDLDARREAKATAAKCSGKRHSPSHFSAVHSNQAG